MYHGTERTRGQRMINCKRMEITRGARHWLGDGSYFYEEDCYAYRWIYDMYKTKYPDRIVDHEDLLKKYMIIEADLNVNRERIFSFMNPEHKQLFDFALNECIKRSKGQEIVDGAVLNLMFNIMGYRERYDAVIAVFLHDDTVMNDKKIREGNVSSRLSYVPEIQICVKNLNVIENLKELNTSGEQNRLLRFAESYTSFAGKVKIKFPKRNGARYKAI